MKILRKISSLEVKRAFVTAQKMRQGRERGKRHLPKLTRTEFVFCLSQAKEKTRKLSEAQLDKIISNDYQKRADAYKNSDWYLARASVNEIGVWRRAGGLPSHWTCCSLAQTAVFLKKALRDNSRLVRARSKRALPRIGEHVEIISREPALFPIVFLGGTGTCGRGWCRIKLAGDIDDGCMRSIALTIAGAKTLMIYFGKPKKLLNTRKKNVK